MTENIHPSATVYYIEIYIRYNEKDEEEAGIWFWVKLYSLLIYVFSTIGQLLRILFI